MGLDFVEKDERIARNELFSWVDQGIIADDGIRAITVRSDCAIFRFLNEVDFHYRTVVVCGKVIDSLCLAYLTRALDD